MTCISLHVKKYIFLFFFRKKNIDNMTIAVEEVRIVQNLARLYWDGKPKVAAAQAAYLAEVAACEQKVRDMGMGKVCVLRLHVRNAVKDILFPTAYRRDVAYAFLHWQNRRGAKCLNMEKLWLILAGGEGSLAIKYHHLATDLVPFLSCFRGPAHDRNQMLAIQKDIDFAERVLDNGFALQIDAKDAFHGVVLFENAEEAHIARYAVSNVFRIFDVESVLSTQIRRAIPSDKDCCVMVVDDRMEDDETSHVFELGDGFAHKIVNKVMTSWAPSTHQTMTMRFQRTATLTTTITTPWTKPTIRGVS